MITYTEPIACLSCMTDDSRLAFTRSDDEHLRKMGAPERALQYRICRRCGLVFQNPRITREVEGALYAAGGYHGFTETSPPLPDYLDRHLMFAEREVRWIMNTLRMDTGDGRQALDIGAGAGFGVVAMNNAGWQAVASSRTALSPPSGAITMASRSPVSYSPTLPSPDAGSR